MTMFSMLRFSCTYLIEAHAAQLVQAGGKQEWLDQGLVAAPIKVQAVMVEMVIVVGNTWLWPILVDHTYDLQIQKLYDLNKILAHRPWSLTPNHIEELTKYSFSFSSAAISSSSFISTSFSSTSIIDTNVNLQ